MKVAVYCHSIAPSIDGVCRRFTALLNELVKQGHDIILFTLEDQPEDLPALVDCVTLDHMFVPTYPDKKTARPNLRSFSKIWSTLRHHKPDVLHLTADGFSHMFALICLLLQIPVCITFVLF